MTVADQEIHLNDVGTAFEITVVKKNLITGLMEVVDISSTTLRQIIFKKPSLATVPHTAVFITDGTDGKMLYISVADDLDQAGDWELQGYIEMPTWQGHTVTGKFEVEPNL